MSQLWRCFVSRIPASRARRFSNCYVRPYAQSVQHTASGSLGAFCTAVGWKQEMFTQIELAPPLGSLAAPYEEYLATISNENSTTDLRVIIRNNRRLDEEYDRQYDCLAMSLESGLDLLSGLRSLRVVALKDMEVNIDNENEKSYDEFDRHQEEDYDDL
ncbi:hypothetical protein BKA57DRAFT_532653 [Linnemannia elongata]|nr:hypothetical protein BKA57DRAFT_532653 [Linnemannia elongata]